MQQLALSLHIKKAQASNLPVWHFNVYASSKAPKTLLTVNCYTKLAVGVKDSMDGDFQLDKQLNVMDGGTTNKDNK